MTLLRALAGTLLLPAAAAAQATPPVPTPDWQTVLAQTDSAVGAGRHVQAEIMVDWLEENAPGEARGRIALSKAELSVARGDVTAAAEAFAHTTPADGGACRHSRVAGWIAGKTGAWNRAIVQLAAAIESCEDDAELWNLLGLALTAKAEFDAALEAFDSALLLEPAHPALLNNRALALLAAGRIDAAGEDLRAATRLRPDDRVIVGNLDYLSAMQGSAPVRADGDSDARWAMRLARAGEGAHAAARQDDAAAYFASATLLLDRFDPRLWSLGAGAGVEGAAQP